MWTVDGKDGWQIEKHVVSKTCTDFNDSFSKGGEIKLTHYQNDWAVAQGPRKSLAADFSEHGSSMFFRPICDCGKTADAHLPIIFSIQETRSWNVPELQLPGLCVMVAKLGSPRWWFRISFSKLSDL